MAVLLRHAFFILTPRRARLPPATQQGQVRVSLQGTAAQAVAESRIGIGDEVVLSLEGAQWQEDQSERDPISTPGKNVDWQLLYRRRITLRAYRDGRELRTVDINQQAGSPQRQSLPDTFSTPGPIRKEQLAHSTPNLLFKHGRLSGDSLTFSPYDPFVEGNTRANKRLRRSWHDVESWTVSDRGPSPEKDADPFLVNDGLSESSVEQDSVEPPIGPGLPTSFMHNEAVADHDPLLTKGLTAGMEAANAVGLSPPRNGDGEDSQSKPEVVQQDVRGIKADLESTEDDSTASQSVLSKSTQERQFAVFQDVIPQSRILSSTFESVPETVAGNASVENGTSKSNRVVSATASSKDETHITDGSHHQPILLNDSDDEVSIEEENLSLSKTTSMKYDNMPPPAVARPLSLATSISVGRSTDHSSAAPRTPELRGVASPTLPLPSPFPATNETTATSFLDVRPQQRASRRRTSAPKTIKETLQEEKHKLHVPRSDRRTSRTSSSSSYRRESGPFAEHIRTARPFGLDGVTSSVEEAVTDSPEIKPINREIPGLKTLESLSEAPLEPSEDLVPGSSVQARAHSTIDQTGPDTYHEDHSAPTWMSEEWFEAPSGFFDEFIVDSGDPIASRDSDPRLSEALTPMDVLPSSAGFDTLLPSTNYITTINLENSSSAKDSEDRASQNQPLTLSYPSNELDTITRSRAQQFPSLVSPSEYPTVFVGNGSEQGSSQAEEIVSHVLNSTPTASVENQRSASTRVLYPDLSVPDVEGTPSKTTDSAPGSTHPSLPRLSPDESNVSYPNLPYSPTSSATRRSPAPQLTPPPTAPTPDQAEALAPSSPEMEQITRSELEAQAKGETLLTPNATQATTESTPSRSNGRKSRHGQPPILSDAISRWFAPSRQDLRSPKSHSEAERHEDLNPQEDTVFSSSQYLEQKEDATTQVPMPTPSASLAAQAKVRLTEMSKHLELSTDLSTSDLSGSSLGNGDAVVPKGFRTPLSYYTPLHPTLLRPYLNTLSQHESTIDVIAVVSSPSSTPKRAEKGPRDWHQIVSVITPDTLADNDTWPEGEVRVQCFMGGKAGAKMLPNAQPGDVILLRDFRVVSEKGSLGLINRHGGCGWCVWRWGVRSAASEAEHEDGDGMDDADPTPLEEISGAPVELGDAERQEARLLRIWYEGLLPKDMIDEEGEHHVDMTHCQPESIA